MAENLVKDQTLAEETKKQKKVLYKNWKFYASALGIIVIGTGTGLGIYYGVNANSSDTNAGITDQDIITGINNINYQATINAGAGASTINDLINAEFIQSQLNDEIKTSFNAEAFNFNKITIDGNDLQDSDLTTPGTLTVKINYNYGEKTNQETNLTISIMATSAQVIEAINNVKTYELKANLAGAATSITEQINADFIKQQLKDENISNVFNGDLFNFSTVTVGEDNHQLTNSDLGKIRTLDAKINYTYDSSEMQTTNLKIDITISLPLDIGLIVNDENRDLTLEGVISSSPAEEIIDAIFKALVPVVKDIVGEDLSGLITEGILKANIDINLDDSTPIAGATITAKDNSLFIIGSANITFTLSEE